MNNATRISPLLPTTEISADAPRFIMESRDYDRISREVDVTGRVAGFIQDIVERYRHKFELTE